jgi:hypothetical protein
MSKVGMHKRNTEAAAKRFLKRHVTASKQAMTAANGGGTREQARRIKQMLKSQLKAENGVVQVYDTETHTLTIPNPERVLEASSD